MASDLAVSNPGWTTLLRGHSRQHGLAAGAMIFVVSHGVIPETHRNGQQTPATFGLMAGFALVMVLDITLG